MVRTVVVNNPDLKLNELSLLTEDVAIGATTIKVQNTGNLAVNDFVVLGIVGSEKAEVLRIATIFDSTTLTVVTGSIFAHVFDEPITKIDSNQIKIYRSIDGGVTFPLLATINIDYNSPKSTTEYIDTAGIQTYIYRYTFFNSFSLVETAQSQNIVQTKIQGYITVDEFKAQTGLAVADVLIEEAIVRGANWIRRELYAPRVFRTGEPKTEQFLPVYARFTFADGDLSNTAINKNDFYAFEEDPSLNGLPGTRTDITFDITAVDVNRNTITFGTARPTSNKTLVVVFWETWEKLKFTETDQSVLANAPRWDNIELKQLNKLMAVNYIFENVPFQVLIKGISQWSLGGVSVNFDYDVVQKVMADNKKKINDIRDEIERIYIRYTEFRRPERGSMRDYLRPFTIAGGFGWY